MYSIIYRSLAKPDFGQLEIYLMLSKARENNLFKGITGCLLFHKNEFLQLLEGDKNEVTELYENILVDTRHHHIETLKEETIAKPIFKDWSMAYYDFGNTQSSRYHKLLKINSILERSDAFSSPSVTTLSFFKTVNEILFTRN